MNKNRINSIIIIIISSSTSSRSGISPSSTSSRSGISPSSSSNSISSIRCTSHISCGSQ